MKFQIIYGIYYNTLWQLTINDQKFSSTIFGNLWKFTVILSLIYRILLQISQIYFFILFTYDITFYSE